MNTFKKYISLGLCLILLFTALAFVVYHFSDLSQQIMFAGSARRNAPSPPDEDSLSSNLSQSTLLAGFSIEGHDPSRPEEA